MIEYLLMKYLGFEGMFALAALVWVGVVLLAALFSRKGS